MRTARSTPSLEHILSRRAALAGLAGIGATALLAACGSDSKSASTTAAVADTTAQTTASTTAETTASTTATSTAATSGSTAATTATTTAAAADLVEIPDETGGPYPGDGTNGPNVLSTDGVVRSDIRQSIGDASGVADGVPLTIDLTILDTATGTPLTGAAVYLWHCDREGNYSMYSQAAEDENYLRGVQVADSSGKLSFTTIFPGAYSGRWPHIHFEVFSAVDQATIGSNAVKTSQLALPEDVCDAVYAADSGYSASIRNMDQTSLESDNVFGDDGAVHEMATVTGDVTSGLVASLVVPV